MTQKVRLVEDRKIHELPTEYPLYYLLSARAIVPRIADKLSPGGGWYIDEKTQKITGTGRLDPFRPWIYTYPDIPDDRPCLYFKEILWARLNHFPSFCREVCHKVVVRPRTVVELVRLYDLQKELQFHAKCGIEKRKICPALYGGYFYTNSMEEGKERLHTVKKAVGKKIGHKVPVDLKKGCTEMELKHGPSDKWPEVKDAERKFEEEMLKIFEPPLSQFPQPDWLKDDIMLSWFDSAWEHNDMSVMAFTDNKPIITPTVSYYND